MFFNSERAKQNEKAKITIFYCLKNTSQENLEIFFEAKRDFLFERKF